MNQKTVTYPEFDYIPESGWGALYFHRWLMMHPKLSKYNRTVDDIMRHSSRNKMQLTGWSELIKGIDIMFRAHGSDARQNKQSPYLIHQFQIISDYIDRYNANLHDILIFLLHDVIEDHPEFWKEIYNTFGLQTFRDVLILSTGGFNFSQRRSMLSFFIQEHPGFISSSPGETIHDIIQILTPEPPLRKLNKHSIYAENNQQYELSAIKKAIQYYATHLLKVYPIDEDTVVLNEEYIGLGTYIYMNKSDVFRKLQDMLHNMKDMQQMEDQKPGYIAKRHIKAYILMVKMKSFGMRSEVAQLLSVFQKAGHPFVEGHIELQIDSDGA